MCLLKHLKAKAAAELKEREEEDKARRQAAEDAKKKRSQEQAEKTAQERLKVKQKTNFDLNFDFENIPKSTYRNVFDKPKSSLEMRENPSMEKNKAKTTLAKSDTIKPNKGESKLTIELIKLYY